MGCAPNHAPRQISICRIASPIRRHHRTSLNPRGQADRAAMIIKVTSRINMANLLKNSPIQPVKSEKRHRPADDTLTSRPWIAFEILAKIPLSKPETSQYHPKAT